VDSAVATIIGAAIGAIAGVGGAAVTAWRQTQMERQKSELSVWADFRNDILKDMWASHRAAVAAMTDFILRTQEVKLAGGNVAHLKKDLDVYRSHIHRSIDLLTPTALNITQKFVEVAYIMLQWDEPSETREIFWRESEPPDDNTFKGIRRELTEHMTVYFHLGEVLPWMLRESKQDQSLADSGWRANFHKFGLWMGRAVHGLAKPGRTEASK
jgi:hypothetical protein